MIFAPNQLGLLSHQAKLSIYGKDLNALWTTLLSMIGSATTSGEPVYQEDAKKFVDIERFCGARSNYK
ncbi:hypothetical protein TcWFU_007392 [Taenia crassiceps]|uniref:Uncharacterized protein n=1 Tax=Taenia crassiceps TaxID=6207 RepID=A0ABR4QEL4_9CEST